MAGKGRREVPSRDSLDPGRTAAVGQTSLSANNSQFIGGDALEREGSNTRSRSTVGTERQEETRGSTFVQKQVYTAMTSPPLTPEWTEAPSRESHVSGGQCVTSNGSSRHDQHFHEFDRNAHLRAHTSHAQSCEWGPQHSRTRSVCASSKDSPQATAGEPRPLGDTLGAVVGMLPLGPAVEGDALRPQSMQWSSNMRYKMSSMTPVDASERAPIATSTTKVNSIPTALQSGQAKSPTLSLQSSATVKDSLKLKLEHRSSQQRQQRQHLLTKFGTAYSPVSDASLSSTSDRPISSNSLSSLKLIESQPMTHDPPTLSKQQSHVSSTVRGQSSTLTTTTTTQDTTTPPNHSPQPQVDFPLLWPSQSAQLKSTESATQPHRNGIGENMDVSSEPTLRRGSKLSVHAAAKRARSRRGKFGNGQKKPKRVPCPDKGGQSQQMSQPKTTPLPKSTPQPKSKPQATTKPRAKPKKDTQVAPTAGAKKRGPSSTHKISQSAAKRLHKLPPTTEAQSRNPAARRVLGPTPRIPSVERAMAMAQGRYRTREAGPSSSSASLTQPTFTVKPDPQRLGLLITRLSPIAPSKDEMMPYVPLSTTDTEVCSPPPVLTTRVERPHSLLLGFTLLDETQYQWGSTDEMWEKLQAVTDNMNTSYMRDTFRCHCLAQTLDLNIHTVSLQAGTSCPKRKSVVRIDPERHLNADFAQRYRFFKAVLMKWPGVTFSSVILDYFWLPVADAWSIGSSQGGTGYAKNAQTSHGGLLGALCELKRAHLLAEDCVVLLPMNPVLYRALETELHDDIRAERDLMFHVDFISTWEEAKQVHPLVRCDYLHEERLMHFGKVPLNSRKLLGHLGGGEGYLFMRLRDRQWWAPDKGDILRISNLPESNLPDTDLTVLSVEPGATMLHNPLTGAVTSVAFEHIAELAANSMAKIISKRITTEAYEHALMEEEEEEEGAEELAQDLVSVGDVCLVRMDRESREMDAKVGFVLPFTIGRVSKVSGTGYGSEDKITLDWFFTQAPDWNGIFVPWLLPGKRKVHSDVVSRSMLVTRYGQEGQERLLKTEMVAFDPKENTYVLKRKSIATLTAMSKRVAIDYASDEE